MLIGGKLCLIFGDQSQMGPCHPRPGYIASVWSLSISLEDSEIELEETSGLEVKNN